MSDFCSDVRDTSFVKSPANTVVDLYEQYVHDLADVLDRNVPLLSRLAKKESADWLSKNFTKGQKSIEHKSLSLPDCLVQWIC